MGSPWTQWPGLSHTMGVDLGTALMLALSLWEWICSLSHWNLWAAFPVGLEDMSEWKRLSYHFFSIFPNSRRSRHWTYNMVLTNSVEFIHQSFWIFSIQHYKGTDTYSCLRCKLRCLVLECVALSHETAFKITSIPGPNTDHLVYQIIEWEKYRSLLMRACDAPMFFWLKLWIWISAPVAISCDISLMRYLLCWFLYGMPYFNSHPLTLISNQSVVSFEMKKLYRSKPATLNGLHLIFV